MHLTLTGAYGRDYRTEELILADWNADKDFIIQTPGYPKYVNKQQSKELLDNGIEFVRLRFCQRMRYTDVALE